MQAIKDSPLINTSDPKSIFNTETDPAKLINYINNYRNTLAVYAANPFYFPHQRLGSVAFIVTEVIDGKSENVWVETHAPKEFKKNLLTADFNEIKNTKKYKVVMKLLTGNTLTKNNQLIANKLHKHKKSKKAKSLKEKKRLYLKRQ